MTDSVPERIESLSAQLEGLEAAAEGLATDPTLGVSVRRIARLLERAARALDLEEIAAGAMAIQRAAEAHLERSVGNFLVRVEELRQTGPSEESTVLIVEDNKTVAAATRAHLRAPGRTLILAETASEALRVLEESEVDAVILDLILPDRDGRDVLVQMREQASTATTPVIVLSSTTGQVAKAECLAVGADEFLDKPVARTTLRGVVARQIKSGRERRDAVRDGLTGLANRVGLHAEFEEQRRKTLEESATLTVAVVTFDSLTEITMKLGRDAGDRFLLEVSAVLHETMGKGLGRWETAEWVAVLPRQTAEGAKRTLKEAIGSLMRDEVFAEFGEAGIEVSLSGGVTLVGRDQSLHDAVSAAERSLYTAKAAQAGSVHSADDLIEIDLRRILLLEDDRVTSTLIQQRLVREGHDVVDFANGNDAQAWVLENDFDLAVLDVRVPGMDGFELLAKLRATSRFASVPIIMLTVMGREADVVRGLELGADDYLLKPFSTDELLARVRRLLHASTTGARRADT